MKQSSTQQQAAHATIGDQYLLALAGLLVGYAIFGKVFAYLGVPPFYVGELVFAIGIILFLRSGCAIATLAAVPNLLLIILVGWAAVRALPYIGEYGLDTLRDGVIVGYSGFAFITAALLLEKPDRLSLVISFLGVFAIIIAALAPALVLMADVSYFSPSGEPSLSYVKVGTTGVHLTAAALLMLLGFRRLNLVLLILLLIGMATAASQNRGGMLAMMVMLSVAVIATGKLREFSLFLAVAAVLIGVAYMLDVSIPTQRMRDISAAQLVDNFLSVFGASEANLDMTRTWRAQWWASIVNYTFNGPYFWAGKGFGVNLALADGVVSGAVNPLVPILRSPHNGHLTILARTGVPGLALWLLAFVSWSIMLLADMVRAQRRGDNVWANFFLLVFCYGLGFMVDGTFDVTLEGPMAGIWFWCLFGVGIGASMIYRAEVSGLEPQPSLKAARSGRGNFIRSRSPARK